MKFFPGLRCGDGSIITQIHRVKTERGWVYPDGVDPDSPEANDIKPAFHTHVRMDFDPPREEKWVMVNPFSEVYRGWWDGETVVEWKDANRKVEEKRPCLSCDQPTLRWDHLVNDHVCWDCCDKKRFKELAKSLYKQVAVKP